MDAGIVIGVVVVCLLILLFYFIPTFIAYSRKHESKGWVLFLNIILGWSGLGWIFCLIWAAFGKSEK